MASGEVISARERFRRFIMAPENRDSDGNFHIQFTTHNLENPTFSSLLASDRIRSIRINLVGDNLGAGVTSAQVQLIHGGTSYLRSRTRDMTGVAPLIAYHVSGRALDTGAHLESVLPRLAHRQWTLSLPFSVRFKGVHDSQTKQALRL